ncbi:DEAD/DEAH box helicase [Ornithinimicrobium avium]|uniref:ATP-dependent helicase n=1 Tax=Ornithinimicrobium avium TaxID=2283195 RepID=A0A345NK62_9MICO|nr:DEAD/DEAH box helicase [Ornithinimicrobium avium]AXH95420.1 ATP-dependent helicase [Ornithinimicrobium avium]
MEREERERLHEAVEAGERLSPVARRVAAYRQATHDAADEAAAVLTGRLCVVDPPGAPRWRVLPLGPEDGMRLGRLSAAATLMHLTAAEDRLLHELAEDVPRASREIRALGPVRRLFTSRRRREAATQAAQRLLEGHRSWASERNQRLLDRLDAQGREPALPLAPDQALSPRAGLRDRLGPPTAHEQVVDVPGLARLPEAVALLASLLTRKQHARASATAAGEAVRDAAVLRLLEAMPVERLRTVTRERLRVGALADAGITTVRAVLEAGQALERLPGVGELTARRMVGAAESLRGLARADASVRLDPQDRTPEAEQLLAALHTWEVLRQAAKARDLLALAQALGPLAGQVAPGSSHLVVLSGGSDASDLLDLLLPLPERAAELAAALADVRRGDPWADFVRRPSDYFALLSELGLAEETGTYGELPDDVVEAVRRQELDGTHLRVSLRGYQSFGARFALVQKKVLIGDEMGLGKTIEALAVLAHRAAEGGRWFLVVCPASVVTNWVREVTLRTGLAARKVHGTGRDHALRQWRAEGGVAVTTYATLGRIWADLDGFELDGLVVDEAHYVKNPGAARSERVGRLAARTEYVVLLSGTPLENRLGEFAALVGHLRPELLDGEERTPLEFSRAVAPVYLRRNAEDVLLELPELVEVDEWLDLSRADERAYSEAVAQGSFMAMRRAAFRSGPRSAKLERLVEIVEEAEANGRRVLVFSYFREVLLHVTAAVPGRVFGPLTGSVPPAQRQAMVDEFSAAEGGAVLVAQIQAGGVGLNIQAASVVVICEPQVKPTMEWQAVARARRMGQLESVQVHRLLAEDSVDERMVEILSGKSEIFHRFARVSQTAQAAPEAVDVSEADLARLVITAERERLFPQEALDQPQDAPAPLP